jgi:hypothetical protein
MVQSTRYQEGDKKIFKKKFKIFFRRRFLTREWREEGDGKKSTSKFSPTIPNKTQ